MAGQLKLRRGTTSQLANYTGSEGELTYDTALKSLVLHDGVTLGGVKIPYLSNGLVPSTMLPTATELVVGASKIATTAIAQAGANDTDFLTAKKLRDALNASGEAPISAIRSYVIGSATSAPTILRSMNVASVTKPTSTQLTVNFIKPMTDTNYIVLAYAKFAAAPNEFMGGVAISKTVSSCTINLRMPNFQSDNPPEYTVVIL